MRNYHAYLLFCREMDKYFRHKKESFETDEAKIDYAELRLRDSISTAWDRKREEVDLSTFTYDDFKEFLLDEIAPPGSRRQYAMDEQMRWSGKGVTPTQLREKAEELMEISGIDDEKWWACWMMMKMAQQELPHQKPHQPRPHRLKKEVHPRQHADQG